METNGICIIFRRKPAVSLHGDLAEARVDHQDLDCAVLNVLFGHEDLDQRVVVLVGIFDGFLDEGLEDLDRDRFANEFAGDFLEIRPVQDWHAAGVDSRDRADSARLHVRALREKNETRDLLRRGTGLFARLHLRRRISLRWRRPQGGCGGRVELLRSCFAFRGGRWRP